MNEVVKQFEKVVSTITHGKSFTNENNELIIFRKENIYVSLDGIDELFELKEKVLSQLSRYAIKGVSLTKQKQINEIIEAVVGSHFSDDELEFVYSKFGNGINSNGLLEYIGNLSFVDAGLFWKY